MQISENHLENQISKKEEEDTSYLLCQKMFDSLREQQDKKHELFLLARRDVSTEGGDDDQGEKVENPAPTPTPTPKKSAVDGSHIWEGFVQ